MMKRTLILAGLSALSLSWAQAGIESSAGGAGSTAVSEGASSVVRQCEEALPRYRQALGSLMQSKV